MRVVLFGATGMLGQGVLRECLLDPDVESVLSVVRAPTGLWEAKLRERVAGNFFDFTGMEAELTGMDACFFCLGVSSAGMKEEEYRRTTYDITLAAAEVLARLNPKMIFEYISGAGTDSTERGVMWARVKGATENALLRLPLEVYLFRPAAVIPLHGVRSKTKLYQMIYTVLKPVLPLLRAWAPKYVTTTEELGRAMLRVAKRGAPKRVIENSEISHVSAG